MVNCERHSNIMIVMFLFRLYFQYSFPIVFSTILSRLVSCPPGEPTDLDLPDGTKEVPLEKSSAREEDTAPSWYVVTEETEKYVVTTEGLAFGIDAREGELRLEEEGGEMKSACIAFPGPIDPNGVSAKRHTKKNKLKITVPKKA